MSYQGWSIFYFDTNYISIGAKGWHVEIACEINLVSWYYVGGASNFLFEKWESTQSQ